MQRKPPTARAARRPAPQRGLELPPERAFVLHLDARAQLPRRVIARVEHVTSGRVTHVTSMADLMGFLADVLRGQTIRDATAARGPERQPDEE